MHNRALLGGIIGGILGALIGLIPRPRCWLAAFHTIFYSGFRGGRRVDRIYPLRRRTWHVRIIAGAHIGALVGLVVGIIVGTLADESTRKMGKIIRAIAKGGDTAIFATYFFPYLTSSTGVSL